MKIEELTGCFDSITPTKEQKEKMLAGILRAKEEAPVKVIKLNKYKITSIAAVIAVGVFVAVYSNIGKNILTKVDTESTVENNDVSTYAVNDVQKKNVQESVENDNTKPESNKGGTVPTVTEDSSVVEEESTTKNFYKEYSEPAGENAKNIPSTAMYFDGKDLRMSPVPESTEQQIPGEAIIEDDMEDLLDVYDGSAGGGGGGGSASGGGSAGGSGAAYKTLTITEVMNHSTYSRFMPVVYTDKFNFYNAMEYTNRLKVVFKNDVGNYMSMSVFKYGDYDFYEQVLTPEEIKNMKSDGYMNFAVKCGDYYIVYNIETNNSLAVYDMVVSSEYFDN